MQPVFQEAYLSDDSLCSLLKSVGSTWFVVAGVSIRSPHFQQATAPLGNDMPQFWQFISSPS
jgi:hypothetical protein